MVVMLGYVMPFVHIITSVVTCHCPEAPTVAAGAWSWVTAKFYKPAGQQEEDASDEQVAMQQAEPNAKGEKSHKGMYIL